MGKLILGIIAVVCLDLAFVAFMANDRAEESAKLVVDQAFESDLDAGSVTPASLSVYDEPEATVATAPVYVRTVFKPVVVTRRVEVGSRLIVPNKERFRSTPIETRRSIDQDTFEARIIEPRPRKNTERAEAEQRALIYELATMNDRRSEKRSFVASTVVPVVKKPWDLINAVGDTLR
jgi:hypothetical protein